MTVVCILCQTLLAPRQPPNNDDDALLLPRKHRRLPQRKLSNILDLKKPKHLRLLNLQQPLSNTSKFECVHVHTKTRPSFPICVYDVSKDKYISGALLSGGIWEPYITAVFQRVLSKYPEATLIDIGANIGYYSLLALHMHWSVIAIEPQWENIQRLHKGAQLSGKLDRIELLHNALSNTHTNVSLTENADNQGGIQVKSIKKRDKDKPKVETIVMDDLLQIADFTQAIIKIDIEGYECKAMAEAKRFLDKIYVPYIFMEWKQMFIARDKPDSPCPMVAIETLAKDLTSRGYVPHEARTGFQLNPKLASSAWRIGDLYWRHKSASKLQADF